MTSYVYRRKLTRDELMPAIAAGVGAGLGVAIVTSYLTQIFLRRTPVRHSRALRHSREGWHDEGRGHDEGWAP